MSADNKKGERDIIRSLIRDLSSELLESGALRRISPWDVRPKHLVNIYEPRRKKKEEGAEKEGEDTENIICAGVVALPLFPNRETGDADFARLVFVHVKELTKAAMESILKLAMSLKVRVLSNSGWAGNIRDTDVIVIADKMEKSVNYTFAKHARIRSQNGNRGSMVFSSKQSTGIIRKHLYGILAKWFEARATAVRERVESRGFSLFSKLEECVEYVFRLADGLNKLADRISVPVRFRKKRYTEPVTEQGAYDELAKLMNAQVEMKPGDKKVKWKGVTANVKSAAVNAKA